ncbi:glutathione S-transferase family protein [Altererythrobacter fulvus]|uniref:glutathione S-transferase family protein n=1 Tax=Caenibius fulvus TaxID=2126012 RepID=UPI0030180609
MNDCPTLTAFDWVPDFARGLVRDLRVRWALEEIGRPYETQLYGAMAPRPDDYLAWQPFDQVPAFADKGLKFFESGAILLYLGEQDERLLPAAPQARWNAISWLFAALNSVEPHIGRLVSYDVFHADKDWAKEARQPCAALVERKLMRVSDALGDKDWLAGTFSVADIAMATVFSNLRHTGMIDTYPKLARYLERAFARPAYARALDAQLADFSDTPPQMQGA